MKIAMVHNDLPPASRGGVAVQVARLSTVLAQRGHEVCVHTTTPPADATEFAVSKIAMPTRTRLAHLTEYAALPLAFAAHRYGEPDVIHAHGDSQLLWRRRVPVVRTFYGSARDEAASAERWPRRVSQLALVPAEHVARRIATVTVGISANTERSIGPLDELIPCGVDREAFRPGEKSATPTVLFVGTLTGRKRGHVLVEQFERIVAAQVPDAKLWCVCPEPVSSPNVRWLDRVDDDEIARLYRRAWLFCSPSRYEGFGVPYIEAMASGTVCVATPNPGSLEVLGPSGAGVLCADGELGPTISRLLQTSQERLALESRTRAYSERYDWRTIAARYEAVYKHASERGSTRPIGHAR